jgi:hypothetical protein
MSKTYPNGPTEPGGSSLPRARLRSVFRWHRRGALCVLISLATPGLAGCSDDPVLPASAAAASSAGAGGAAASSSQSSGGAGTGGSAGGVAGGGGEDCAGKGTAMDGEACVAHAECAPGLVCFPPEAIVCTDCAVPVIECSTDAECDTARPGTVCGVYPVPCDCRSHGPAYLCTTPCSQTGCAADESCIDGRTCWPTHCKDGYVCPVNHVCSADVDFLDYGYWKHGCRRQTCSTDADCDPGTCVEVDALVDGFGLCFETPGACREGSC